MHSKLIDIIQLQEMQLMTPISWDSKWVLYSSNFLREKFSIKILKDWRKVIILLFPISKVSSENE